MQQKYSSSDLRRIAKLLDEWERLLIEKDGSYKARSEGVSRIEITFPDDINAIGHFVLEDEWLAFVPRTEEEQ